MHSTVSTAGATDTRMICLRRDLSSSPGQLLAQNRLSCEVRLGCLGIYPVWTWKLPRMEAILPPWAACSTTWLSSLMSSVSLSWFYLYLLSLILPSCTTGKGLVLSFLVTALNILANCYYAFFSTGWKNFLSLRKLSLQGKCSCLLTSLVALCWTCTSFSVPFPNLDAIPPSQAVPNLNLRQGFFSPSCWTFNLTISYPDNSGILLVSKMNDPHKMSPVTLLKSSSNKGFFKECY